MAAWHSIQSSFKIGEVSPRFAAEVNDEFAKNAAAEIYNGVVLLQGSATKRLGTSFSALVPISTGNQSDPARIWPMFAPDNQEIVAVFTHEFVTLIFDLAAAYGDSVPIVGQIQTVLNPSFEQGFNGWSYDGATMTPTGVSLNTTLGSIFDGVTDLDGMAVLSATWDSAVVIFDTYAVGIDQTLNIPDPATELTYSLTALEQGAPEGIPVVLRLKCGTTPGGNDIFQQDINIPNGGPSVNYTAVMSGFAPVSGTVYLRVEYQVTIYQATFFAHSSLAVDDILLYANDQTLSAPISVITPYTSDQVEDLHFSQSPFDDQALFIFHPDVEPNWLYFNGVSWIVEPVVFTSSPSVWAGTNWPSICTSYQGRLILSGTADDPETIWASRSNDWTDFVEGGTITPESPFEFTPTERGVNTWLHGHKTLLFGNTRDEFSVDAQSGIIQAADVAVLQQTGYGGMRNPQRLRMGHAIVSPTNGSQTIKLIQYSRDAGGYIAPDIMLQAEHLGKRGVRRLFYTRDPHEMLWAVMLDGTLCTMSFNSEQQIRAWSTWKTEGVFLDATTIVDTTGGTVVVLIVQRNVNGALQTQVEYLNNLRDVKNWRYLDAAVRRTITSNIVFNIVHLEGLLAHVFLDGSYAGTRVVSSGEIDLTGLDWQNASIVDIGIGYNFRLKTLPQGTLTPQIGLAAKKRFSKVGIRGMFSRVPIIQGQRYPERNASALMNETQPATDLLDTFVCDLGTNTTAEVVIEEPLPVRLTVAGIYGKLSGNEL